MTDALQPPQGWHTATMPRITPPAPAQRGTAFRLVSRLAKRFGRAEIPDIFVVFNINRRLFWPWLFFASRLMPYGRLNGRHRELIILRTGWNCRSRYEWGQHVDIALRNGASDDDVLRSTQAPELWPDPVLSLLMRACDELHIDHRISDATWNGLSTHFDTKRLIEIVILVGHYQMIAGFLNSAGIALEPATEATLQAFFQRVRSI